MADQHTPPNAILDGQASREATASPTQTAAAVNSVTHGQTQHEAQDQAHINPLPALDDFETDGDSAYGPSETNGATSIGSSIYAGHVEGGRRYQNTRNNAHNVPSDEKQYESMRAGHLTLTVMESLRENPYFRSPISKDAQHIIDLGTGDGEWAMDVADRLPNLTVHGVDLYPPPAKWVPPNCVLEVDDITKPWTWSHKFDLVHMRYMLSTLPRGEWKALYARIYDNLQPGGWVEHIEPCLAFHSMDTKPLPKDSLLGKWEETMLAAAEKSGNPTNIPDFMKQDIQEAGFVNFNEVVIKVPTGDWHSHPVYKDAGRLAAIHFKEGLAGWVTWVLTKYLLWSPEEVAAYVTKMRQELEENYHIWHYYKRVWAQKPFDTKPKAEPEQPVLETLSPAAA